MSDLMSELTALPDCWRKRARRFMEDAQATDDARDLVRLTAMASTLDHMARELIDVLQCWRDRR